MRWACIASRSRTQSPVSDMRNHASRRRPSRVWTTRPSVSSEVDSSNSSAKSSCQRVHASLKACSTTPYRPWASARTSRSTSGSGSGTATPPAKASITGVRAGRLLKARPGAASAPRSPPVVAQPDGASTSASDRRMASRRAFSVMSTSTGYLAGGAQVPRKSRVMTSSRKGRLQA